MSRAEIIKVIDGRPAIVKVDGWTVFLSVRDAEYLRILKQFKRRLAEAHPDKGGTAGRFRKVMSERLRWQMTEASFYASIDLLPPDGFVGAGAKARMERRKRLKGESR